MFNFLCNGLPVPDCLPQEIDYDVLRTVRITSPALVSEWSQILQTATRNGLDERWMRIVRSKLRRRLLLGLPGALSLPKKSGD
jgi:phage gp37-like protein